MADYYVDASATGANNGTSPADAFTSILSVPFAPGDTAWVRNTHNEFLTSSQQLGPAWAIDGFTRWANIVGWPQPGDPFHAIRPLSAVSAGWDSDLPATNVYSVYGYKMPLLTTSNANGRGILLPRGGGVYNFCLANTGGAATNQWSSLHGAAEDRVLDNIVFLGNNGPHTYGTTDTLNALCGKVTFISSVGNVIATVPFPPSIAARHVVIHSMSSAPFGLVSTEATPATHIGLLEMQSNSIGYFVSPHVRNPQETTGQTYLRWIERVTGVQPNLGIGSLGVDYCAAIRVDDYYGGGPRIIGGNGNMDSYVSSVLHDGKAATVFEVSSIVASAQRYHDARDAFPTIRKYFDVTSGTPLNVVVPVYIVSAYSLTSGMLRAHLLSPGSNTRICNSADIMPGTPALWTGASAGSAYLWTCVFSPIETASQVPFDLHPGNFLQASSGQGLDGRVMFGEPYAL